jgi:tetratricopeptide (TPR) repeat protein
MKEPANEISAKDEGDGKREREFPDGSRHDWLLGSILVLAVFLAYLPMWRAGYVWDDLGYIISSPNIAGLRGLKEIWTTSAADISPLTFTTFWVEHALWGLAPLPYHLVNVALHGACAIVLWRVLLGLRMTGPGAWLGAALWALHPVEVESVAWITEMKNTESGLFFLLSILFFLRWLRGSREGQKSAGWNYGLTVLFAALAMAGKSSTVVLPIVLCLCAWWIEGRLSWRRVVRTAPIFLLSLVAGAVTIWTQKLHLEAAADPRWVRPWPERLATAGDAVWFYLGKLIWPHPLMTLYPRWEVDASRWVSYLPLAAVIVVLLLLWLKRDSWSRPCFFAFAYFLITLLPALGLVDNIIFHYSLVFDHFQYLASMGPLVLAGAGLAWSLEAVLPARFWLQGMAGAGLLVVLAALSWQRASAFESDGALWADTLSKNPTCWVANNNLGAALLHQGQADEAIARFQKALEANPDYAEACMNIGNALLQKGKVDEATARYRKALEMDPNYDVAHNNLGLALFQKGQVDAAAAEFQKALQINPQYAEAHYSLGGIRLEKGQVDEAIAEYQKALELAPNYAEAHYGLGSIRLQRGEVGEAMAEFQQALAIKPNLAEAHNNLGLAFSETGRIDEAIAQFQEALAINPAYAEAHTNLAIALVQLGRLDEAMPHFQEALRLNPADKNAQANLARAQAMLRTDAEKGK